MKSRIRQCLIAVVALVAWAGIVHALESAGNPDLFGGEDRPAPVIISLAE
jgi:hypothetical protein